MSISLTPPQARPMDVMYVQLGQESLENRGVKRLGVDVNKLGGGGNGYEMDDTRLDLVSNQVSI